MGKLERFDKAPTVEQLVAALGSKKDMSRIERAALWFFRTEMVAIAALVVVGLVNKFHPLPPDAVKDTQIILAGLAVLACLLMCASIICMALPVLLRTGATYAKGLDERIAADRKLAELLKLIPSAELQWLADRVQLEINLIMRRIGLGGVMLAVGSFAVGLTHRDFDALRISVHFDRGVLFVMSLVFASSIAMFMLYTVVDRLERIVYVLKDAAKSGRQT